jgi:pyruvate formate lyase activating enzyme
MSQNELLDQDRNAAGELMRTADQPLPPNSGAVPGRWWHSIPDGRLQCDLCPRSCRLREGQRGFCFVRQALGGQIVLTSYGRNTGMAVDPIEKKPLYHFLPGSRVLSFGTAGCSLGCRFCQNWHISKTRQQSALSTRASPRQVAAAASHGGCRSVAFTYNEPSIFAEYAIDCARQAHRLGLKTVAVTSGYMCAGARTDFFHHIDAANVDLKAFDDDFYRRLCGGSLAPVLDTLRWLKHQTDVWL